MNVLRTDRLLLRRFTPEDVDNLTELDSDPAVTRYLTGGRTTPRETVETEILPRHLAYRGPVGRWAAHDETGAFIGWFALDPRDDHTNVELGYRLRAAAWGRGYATEGSRALVDAGFRDLGVLRVFAETMAVNLGSRRVMEKTGLRYLRTFHLEWDDPIPGTEHGEVEYELLRADWAAQAGA
ncbi:GNAT family N-acetyltransferase [Actinokineospora enzanensis]|uniref:GNAT family N-acetyltransferase n=1 Tax=Actinokineospora enzanensis TaxID=155975 RepID=UPI00036D9EB3|nr:GNAT family N-acetyltransferase [Actinokineospora enzanensis]